MRRLSLNLPLYRVQSVSGTWLKPSIFTLRPFALQCIQNGMLTPCFGRLYNSLTKAGFKSFISAPAENQSGSGSLDEEPSKVGSSGCEFSSCPPNSPPTGKNESMPRFHVGFTTLARDVKIY